MEQLAEALGPIAILGSWVVGLTWWASRMSTRLDHLDHGEHGRVPKVERRVDALEDDISEIKGDVREIKTHTAWIRDALAGAARQRKEPTA